MSIAQSGDSLQADSGNQCAEDRKSTRLNSSHLVISYAVFCLKKKTIPHSPHCRCLPPALIHKRSHSPFVVGWLSSAIIPSFCLLLLIEFTFASRMSLTFSVIC